MIGIYQILNTVNGKMYIGKSSDIKKRFKTHLSQLKRSSHINKNLQSDFDLYGEKTFQFNILTQCLHKYLDRNESLLCYKFNVWDERKGYNIGKLLDYNIISHEEALNLKNSFIKKLFLNNMESLMNSEHSTLEVEWIAEQMNVSRNEMLIALKELSSDDGDDYDMSFTLFAEYGKHQLTIFNREPIRKSLEGFRL